MATVETLNNIRLSLEKHIGRKIVLKANKGRKQIVTKEGILETLYPNVFVVKLDGAKSAGNRVSYSYSDLLTETVKLRVYVNSVEDDNKIS